MPDELKLSELPKKTVKAPGGHRYEVPVGYCHVCWIRWGRALKGEATTKCKTTAGACAGIDPRYKVALKDGETLESFEATREAAKSEYDVKSKVDSIPKKKKK